MKTRYFSWLVALALFISNGFLHAQGTAFTYQGRLNSSANPVTGYFDFTFALYNTNAAGTQIGITQTNFAVGVTNGLFTVTEDFGQVYSNASVWLQIATRTNGASTFIPLSPRQALTPTPFAITAENLTGSVTTAQLPGILGTVTDPGLGNFYVGPGAGGTSGSTFFNVATGNVALGQVKTGSYNEADGVSALYSDNSGGYNVANGFDALYGNTNGNYNTASGAYALSANLSGSLNTADGAQALARNTTGTYNTASGYDALQSGISANFNTADGAYAMSQSGNLTGAANTGIGAYSLFYLTSGYNNSAFGYQSLYQDSTGSENVGLGESSLYALQSGSQNTAVGGYALQSLISGTGNIGIGYNAGNVIGTGTNDICIGSSGGSLDNNVIRIGSGQTDTYLSGATLLDGISTNNGILYGTNLPGPNTSGPFVFGYLGGALGAVSPNTICLSWDYSGDVWISNNLSANYINCRGEYITVTGLSGLDCYIGDDGSGNDVQIGSLKSGVKAVSCYNEADQAYMHLFVSSLTINGGSDLAEPFPIASKDKDIPEGSVVVIDQAHPGQLKLSSKAYDTRVAGVVSGANGINPGIQMQQQGLLEGGKNVALTGRVYVLADARHGAIEPGDLLTTSSTLGHAMKVRDRVKAQGAILGKAMGSLPNGTGMVLVLVSLQ